MQAFRVTLPIQKRGRTALALVATLAVCGIAPLVAHAADISTDDDAESLMIVTADFNRDGIADTATVAFSGGESRLTIALGRPDGSMRKMPSQRLAGERLRSFITGDFDRDGKPDLVIADEDGTVSLLLGDGAGGIRETREIARLDSAISVTSADFDRDGKLDLAISDWRASSITVFLGTGAGQFRQGWSFPMRMRGTTPQLSAADYNGDGIPDLAVIYGDDGQYTYDVMLGNGQGTFTPSPELSTAVDANAHCPT